MSRLGLRAGLAAASAAAAALLGWALIAPGRGGATVELVDSRAEVEALLEAGAGGGAPPAGAGLARRPIPEDVARLFFPGIGQNMVYDEHRLARRLPNLDVWLDFPEHPSGGWNIRTNGLGLREDAEVPEEKADVRILVVGDSHVDGMCENADSFPNLIERALLARHPERSIEVLNGGTGGWAFYNYLGALEGLAHLRPDAFVLTVYGGNDFSGALSLHHHQRGERAPKAEHDTFETVLALGEDQGGVGLTAQYLNQAAYFHDHPGEEAAALEMAVAVTAEVERQCRARGIRLLCIYLPPWPHAQPELCAPLLQEALARAPLPAEALAADERLADAWLAWLSEAGIAALDLRPPFRAHERPLYWSTDHHLNPAGHRAAALALGPPLEELCGLAR